MTDDPTLGPSEDYILVKGTMAHHRAIVTVIESEVTTLAVCDGKHTFTAIRTRRLH